MIKIVQKYLMTLKIRILRCSRRLSIILVNLTVTLFSEKMLTSTRCGFSIGYGIGRKYRPIWVSVSVSTLTKIEVSVVHYCGHTLPGGLRCLLRSSRNARFSFKTKSCSIWRKRYRKKCVFELRPSWYRTHQSPK